VKATADFIENQSDRTTSTAITVALASTVIFILIALVIVKFRSSSARQEDILPTSVRPPTSKGASDLDQLRKLAQLRGRKLAHICVTPARHPGKSSSRDRSPSESGGAVVDNGNSGQTTTSTTAAPAAAAAATAAATTTTPSTASTPLGSMEALSAKALGKQPIDTPDTSSDRLTTTTTHVSQSDRYMHRL
jgi:hypothetical protein